MVELALAKQVEVDGFGAFPGVGQLLVRGGADVAGDQAVHGLGHVGCSHSSAGDLRYLGVEHALLVRVYFEGSEHVYLLDKQWRSVFLPKLLGDSGQNARALGVLVGLAEELDGLHLLVLLDQVRSVPLQQLLDLQEVVLLGQLHGLVPLVKEHAAVDGFLDVAELHVALHGRLAKTEGRELLRQLLQKGRVLGQDGDELFQVGGVLKLVVGLDEVVVVLAEAVVLGGFGPLLALC